MILLTAYSNMPNEASQPKASGHTERLSIVLVAKLCGFLSATSVEVTHEMHQCEKNAVFGNRN